MEGKWRMQEIPGVLRDMLEKGRPEYEALIRQTRWSEGPIYLVGCGAARRICAAGVCAFEELLGWPVVVRAAEELTLYSLSALRPRAVLLIVSASGDAPEALELARQARSRGAVLLSLTRDPASPLGAASDGVFPLRTEADDASACAAVGQHAALTYIALLAARILKRPNEQVQQAAAEFARLPEQIEWAFTQLSDALHSLAESMSTQTRLDVVGGGFYHAPAVRGAWRLESSLGLQTIARAPWDLAEPEAFRRGKAFLMLSSSRSKARKAIHQVSAQARLQGCQTFAITDHQDRELAERSALTVFVPTTVELVGATLTLSLLEWVAAQASRRAKGRTNRPPP